MVNLHAIYLCSLWREARSHTLVKNKGLLPVSKPNGMPWLANKHAQYTGRKMEELPEITTV